MIIIEGLLNMNKGKKLKFPKYRLNIAVSLAGLLSSLFLLYFSYQKYTHIAEQYPVPKKIINIKEEIQPSIVTLSDSDRSIDKQYRSIKEIDKILKDNNLDFTHRWLWSITYSLKLKQELHYSHQISNDVIIELIDNLDSSLIKSFMVSLWYQNFHDIFQEDISPQISQHLENVTYQVLSKNSQAVLTDSTESQNISILDWANGVYKNEKIGIDRKEKIILEQYQKDLNIYLKPLTKLSKSYSELLLNYIYAETDDYSALQLENISIQNLINSLEQLLLNNKTANSKGQDYFIDYIRKTNLSIDQALLKEMIIVDSWRSLPSQRQKAVITEEKIDEILSTDFKTFNNVCRCSSLS
ncbi:MAG: hypothetical protein AAFQ14_05160 [Cyanobacteria bacterium J06621_12]